MEPAKKKLRTQLTDEVLTNAASTFDILAEISRTSTDASFSEECRRYGLDLSVVHRYILLSNRLHREKFNVNKTDIDHISNKYGFMNDGYIRLYTKVCGSRVRIGEKLYDIMTVMPYDTCKTVSYIFSCGHFINIREAHVLAEHLFNNRTFEDIASEMDVSHNRVQQMERKAIHKLRSPTCIGIMLNGMEYANELEKQRKKYRNIYEEAQKAKVKKEEEERAKRLFEGDPNDILNRKILNIGLSNRSYNALTRGGIVTLRDLTNLTKNDIFAIRNFGKTSYDDVVEVLNELGLTLKEN